MKVISRVGGFGEKQHICRDVENEGHDMDDDAHPEEPMGAVAGKKGWRECLAAA